MWEFEFSYVEVGHRLDVVCIPYLLTAMAEDLDLEIVYGASNPCCHRRLERNGSAAIVLIVSGEN